MCDATHYHGGIERCKIICQQRETRMSKELIILIVASLLPAYAYAGKLDLKQDLSGLDLTVAMEPVENPEAVRITNKPPRVGGCTLSSAGASPAWPSTVTVRPGRSDPLRV